MKGYQKPFQLGSLLLSNNIFIAPMSGCTDIVFREMLAAYNPGLIFCEMVKIEGLVRKQPLTMKYLDYDKDLRPIGAQICGRDPLIAVEAAKIIEDLGVDLLDINCGCPVSKVTKDGSGAAMLLHPEEIGDFLHRIIQTIKIPVTIKIRIGWNKKNIIAEEIVKIAEQAGAVGITIHGRTKSQMYKEKADWEIIKLCKQKANKIKVFGNGDIWSAKDAYDMFTTTNCDGIMLARGILGRPWLVQEIEEIFLGKNPQRIDEKTIFLHLKKHLEILLKKKGSDRKVLFDIKKIGCWYLKSFKKAKCLRQVINSLSNVMEIPSILEKIQQKI